MQGRRGNLNKCDWCGADAGEAFPLKPPEVYEPVKVCAKCKEKHEKDIEGAIWEVLFGLAGRFGRSQPPHA